MPGLGDEGRRQAYLAALGIPLWTARQPIAHAAAAQSLAYAAFMADENDFPEENHEVALESSFGDHALAEESASPPGYDEDDDSAYLSGSDGPPDDGPPLDAYLDDPDIRAAATRGPQSGRALTRQVLGHSDTASVKPNSPPRVVPPELTQEDLQPVRFQFALFPCGVHGLIVPRFQLLSPSEDKLLGNLLQAVTGVRAAPLQFAWPMVSNHAMPQHRRAACEALGAFLARQAAGTLKGFVLLGEHEEALHQMLAASTALTVKRQSGLGSLLQQPMRKRELWLALQD
ncbi:MAG: hypothetical protein Q7T36_09555 [Fluviicoccus sp.]|uniref:hypothetical protein n=1 Tax=Fluviicoccus sp. TaxID=2003552 RepID=UPI0027289102|nr:hypothetical protein [Fluviicoccus sp.]MDO8330705.1 hypothetical protein [Fluviicoccus sp.]